MNESIYQRSLVDFEAVMRGYELSPRKKTRCARATRANCANSASTACFASISKDSIPNFATIFIGRRSKSLARLPPFPLASLPAKLRILPRNLFDRSGTGLLVSGDANIPGGSSRMDLGLKGKVALVAGASQGMGKASALGFAREGAKVAICARGEAALKEAAETIRKQTGGEVLAIVADMSKPDDIKKFVNDSANHFGRIDVIVNNAGGPPPGEFMKFTDEDWHNAFNLSFMSTMRMTREAVPHMRKVGGGKVVNITSYSVKEPITGLVLSNAVRSAVIGMAKTLSRELARENILFNNVCPGRIDTDRAPEA